MALVRSSRYDASKTPPTKELQNAVDDFRRILTDDQRAELRKLRAVPDANAVLVFTAQLDISSARSRGPSIASRLHSVLQFVRESSAIIDTFVSSHPEIAALVWGSVKLTMQVVLNFNSYYERISDLFMQFGRDCPRFADYKALFPDSTELQRAVCDFNASIIRCCKHLVEAVQRPWQTQLRNAFLQSFQQEFSPDLEKIRRCGLEVKQEIKLAKVKADLQDQKLQQLEREAAAAGRRTLRKVASRLDGSLDTIKNEQIQRDLRRAEENRRRLLDSLSTYDYLTPYKKACKMRHPATAEWLLQSTNFTCWEEGTCSPWFWCSGKIGSGKTVLTASAIEHTYANRRRSGELVTFFFPEFADPTPLSAETTLRSILRQSVSSVKVSDDWESQLAELDRKPSSEMGYLTTFLRQIVHQTDRFYVFIDGLDEFEPTHRRALLDSLASVNSEPRLRIFLSSREGLSGELKDRVPNIATVSMACEKATADIGTFVAETLQERRRNGDLNVQSESIIDDVHHALTNRADGMFLWVTFLMDEICAQRCDDDVRDAINRLPRSLTETFERALKRIIGRGNSSVAKKAFEWISVAKRRLTLDELREAMSIDIGQPSSTPGKIINGVQQLPLWCENLVRVDEESGTAEFAHKAVHEFIVKDLSGSDLAEFQFELADADRHAGEVCVTYLNFSDFVTTLARRQKPLKVDPVGFASSALTSSKIPKTISSAIRNATTTNHKKGVTETDLATYRKSDDAEAVHWLHGRYPFLKYAAVHWILHTTRLRSSDSLTWSAWSSFVIEGHALAEVPWSNIQEPGELNTDIWKWSVQNRHFAGIRLFWGLHKRNSPLKDRTLRELLSDVELLEAVLEGISADESSLISPALVEAAEHGHVEAVKLLLSVGARMGASFDDLDGEQALCRASTFGHTTIVGLLLSAGTSVNESNQGISVYKAMQAASEGGHIEVLKLLLSAGANMDARFFERREKGRIQTALHMSLEKASLCGHDGVVELLLSAGADVHWRPLLAASQNGHVAVVKLLLSAGADINPGPFARMEMTPLQAASVHGHVEVVELLRAAGGY